MAVPRVSLMPLDADNGAATGSWEIADTRAGDAGLGSPLVCWPPYRDDRRRHPHDRPALDPPGLGIYLAS